MYSESESDFSKNHCRVIYLLQRDPIITYITIPKIQFHNSPFIDNLSTKAEYK